MNLLKHIVSTNPPNEAGFTLIETLVAIVVLVIGIFSLYSMQTTSVRLNASANGMTTSANWAADRVEQILSLDYEDAGLTDNNGNGVGGLDDTGAAADSTATSPDGNYTVSWNIAEYIAPNPSDPTETTLKAVRVIVERNEFGTNKEVTLNYYKQKVF